jgi:hypothetical protein
MKSSYRLASGLHPKKGGKYHKVQRMALGRIECAWVHTMSNIRCASRGFTCIHIRCALNMTCTCRGCQVVPAQVDPYTLHKVVVRLRAYVHALMPTVNHIIPHLQQMYTLRG